MPEIATKDKSKVAPRPRKRPYLNFLEMESWRKGFFVHMERTLARETTKAVGQEVQLKGWVTTVRSHGKVSFVDLRDRTGKIQLVGGPELGELRSEDVIQVTGTIKERSERAINPDMPTGKIELEVSQMHVLAKAADLPLDISKKDLAAELPTLLDHRALTLRHPKVQAIFKVQAVVIEAFREFMHRNEFLEFQAPVIVPAFAEGGAEVFEVQYFDKKAYLTQSPQLYKQIAMSAFERVFSINKVFRAEPSVTSRHLTEILSLDAEMAFIESWTDIRDMAEGTIKYIFSRVQEQCSDELALLEATIPAVIEKTPTISLKEAQEKIYEKTGKDVREEKDLSSEDERSLCEIVFEETGSEIVFVYGYPTRKKPFYVYPKPENPDVNEGIDLLCRGLELMSGGRRVNEYEQLQKHIELWEMDPSKVRMFLEAFSYGVPPEGGFAFGAERITMKILELGNVREATMFPRDMERIDYRFSSEETNSE